MVTFLLSSDGFESDNQPLEGNKYVRGLKTKQSEGAFSTQTPTPPNCGCVRPLENRV